MSVGEAVSVAFAIAVAVAVAAAMAAAAAALPFSVCCCCGCCCCRRFCFCFRCCCDDGKAVLSAFDTKFRGLSCVLGRPSMQRIFHCPSALLLYPQQEMRGSSQQPDLAAFNPGLGACVAAGMLFCASSHLAMQKGHASSEASHPRPPTCSDDCHVAVRRVLS